MIQAIRKFMERAATAACAVSTLCAGALTVSPKAWCDESAVDRAARSVTYAEALQAYQLGRPAEAFVDFESLAQRGDGRAQYLLGMARLEGKHVSKDVAQGYAWLQIAAANYTGAYARETAADARKALAAFGSAISGADLIRADRISGAFMAERARDIQERVRIARVALLAADDASGDRQLVVRGCALDAWKRGCDRSALKSSPAADEAPRCTGVIPAGASRPSTATVRPGIPAPPRNEDFNWEGALVVLLHLDGTGYVCRGTIVLGSGDRTWDKSLLDASTAWRLKPAMLNDQPVESVFVLTVIKRAEEWAWQ